MADIQLFLFGNTLDLLLIAYQKQIHARILVCAARALYKLKRGVVSAHYVNNNLHFFDLPCGRSFQELSKISDLQMPSMISRDRAASASFLAVFPPLTL